MAKKTKQVRRPQVVLEIMPHSGPHQFYQVPAKIHSEFAVRVEEGFEEAVEWLNSLAKKKEIKAHIVDMRLSLYEYDYDDYLEDEDDIEDEDEEEIDEPCELCGDRGCDGDCEEEEEDWDDDEDLDEDDDEDEDLEDEDAEG